ncbi:SKN1-domain-containing protein [Wallemia mellicola]|uniref:SKN1-domain-containing protein n=1 Tax=Wallemia mellicola TaxID=1708541 RepID=A0A4T0NJM3_9BASI|nr:SKN1-domain-containing protein [Wallemia mellicola]TIB96488.1 SKN1-domain-containing protein [Wallemia mellicola]TIC20526.1 SKN1-domain-containing protein [Wallemia mellicola]
MGLLSAINWPSRSVRVTDVASEEIKAMQRSPSSLSSRSGSLTPNRSGAAFSPAQYSASPDPEWWSIDHTSAEDDDDMHDPGTARSGHAFTVRGIMNLGCVSIIAGALLMLFAGYPLLEAFRKRDTDTGGSYGLGGINATGQIPEYSINFGMIDPDTPESVHHRTGFDGKKQVLVFSDEFNVDGRTFYPGEDPYWEAVDLHYWGTNNLEWYSPQQVTTTEGKLAITLDERETHDLDFAGASIALPGTSDVWGLWPAFWTMGNLGRAAYANQTYQGQPTAVANHEVGSEYDEGALSYLPGQRLSRCTCPGEVHPGPIDSKTGEFVGRAAPEIDVFEAQVEIASRTGQVSQSAQWAPFNANYQFIDQKGKTYEFHNDEAEINSYLGGVFQQATSSLATTNQACYSGTNPTPNGSCYSEYGIEFESGNNGHITWASDGEETWTIFGSAMGPDPVAKIGQRTISEEPMYIILNLGISKNFGDVNFDELVFPAIMYVDWVRVYQPEGSINLGCDPKNRPTSNYIEHFKEAYQNPNMTTFVDDYGQEFPKNRFLAPISWALHQIHITDIGTFVTSILGVVPLAALLSFGTEEIALLQSSLLGGLLSNILLVLGMSFIAGGIKFSQQSFKQLPASLNTSLLMLSVMSLMIPLAFHTILGDKFPENPTSEKTFILQMSREEFLDHVEDDGLISPTHPDSTTQAHVTSLSDDLEAGFKRPQLKRARTAPIIATPLMTSTSTYSGSTKCDETPRIDNKRQVEHPRLNIGTIGNAAEHATAVIAAAKGKQELALAVALGSTVQIAIFVIPLIVLLAWIISKPLTLQDSLSKMVEVIG